MAPVGNMVPGTVIIPEQMWLSVVVEDFLQHVNRPVPLWRNEHVAVFWAYRDKKRQVDGSRRGFAWYDVMVPPEVKKQSGSSGGPGTA